MALDAHFPEPAQLDAYGNGGFRFADMSHKGSILVLPSGVHGWDAASAADLTADDLADAIAQKDGMEFLILGTGAETHPLFALKRAMRERGLRIEAMTTGAAARTFNVLLGEERKVGAALIAVD